MCGACARATMVRLSPSDGYLTPAIFTFLSAVAFNSPNERLLRAPRVAKKGQPVQVRTPEEKEALIADGIRDFKVVFEKIALMSRGSGVHNFLVYPSEIDEPRVIMRYVLNKWKDETGLWQYIPNLDLLEGGLRSISSWSKPLWIMIHVWSLIKDRATFSAFMAFICKYLPCEKCREHSQKYLREHEIVDPFVWGVTFHYNVPVPRGDPPSEMIESYRTKYRAMVTDILPQVEEAKR
jgi:hypothetical protein